MRRGCNDNKAGSVVSDAATSSVRPKKKWRRAASSLRACSVRCIGEAGGLEERQLVAGGFIAQLSFLSLLDIPSLNPLASARRNDFALFLKDPIFRSPFRRHFAKNSRIVMKTLSWKSEIMSDKRLKQWGKKDHTA
jgi:hypothetical protein